MKSEKKIGTAYAVIVGVVVVAIVIGVGVWFILKAPEEEFFRIGTLNTMSGDLSFVGPPFVQAEKLAAKHINEAGGVLGMEVKLYNEDTETTATGANEAAKRLVEVRGVHAIVGSVSTFGTMAIVDIISANEIPTISPSATAPDLTTAEDDDFLFRTCPSDTLQGAAIAKVAIDRGYKTASIISRNDAYGIGLEEVFSETFEALGGQILHKVRYDPAAATYDSYLREAAEGDPDMIQLNALMEDGARMLKTAANLGLTDNIRFMASEGVQDPDIPDAVGKTAENEYIVWVARVGGATPYPVGGGPFDAEYLAEYGEEPKAYCANAYDAVVLLALAAEKAGSLDGAMIRDALRDVANPPGEEVSDVVTALSLIREGKEINYQGASGEITFDEHGDVLVGLAREWYYAENGEIVIGREVEIPE